MFEIENGILYQYIEEKGITNVTIPYGVTSIGMGAFWDCDSLTFITIPDSVTNIDDSAFRCCTNLKNIIIPDSVTRISRRAFYKCEKLISKKVNYKAFRFQAGKLTCRGLEYREDEWSEEITDILICERGYHFCDNLFVIFNYYSGEIDKDIAIYECEVGEKIETDGIKCVTNKIKPVKRLYRSDVIKILNNIN